MSLDRRLTFSEFSGGSGGTSRPELSSPKGRSERTLFRDQVCRGSHADAVLVRLVRLEMKVRDHQYFFILMQ